MTCLHTGGTRFCGEEVDVTVNLELVGEEAPIVTAGIRRVQARTKLSSNGACKERREILRIG